MGSSSTPGKLQNRVFFSQLEFFSPVDLIARTPCHGDLGNRINLFERKGNFEMKGERGSAEDSCFRVWVLGVFVIVLVFLCHVNELFSLRAGLFAEMEHICIPYIN